MERIKEAVERARAEHIRAEQGRKTPIGMSAFRFPNEGQGADNLEHVSYTETRVVNLNLRHLERNRIVTVNKTDPRGAAFDMLRTKILNTMSENGWRTIAVTSPSADCGKTTVAINLAISIARQPSYTSLVVDCDLHQPKVGAYLGLPRQNALVDCIEGRREVGDALVNPGIPRFTVLTNSKPVSHASELLTSDRVKELVVELRERYERRVVIFDLPPVLTSDDAIAFLPQVDCALLVIGSGVTTKSDVDDSQRLLASTNVLGTVLNMADDCNQSSY